MEEASVLQSVKLQSHIQRSGKIRINCRITSITMVCKDSIRVCYGVQCSAEKFPSPIEKVETFEKKVGPLWGK